MSKNILLKDSLNYIEQRIEARIPLRDKADVLYLKERLVWLVDKYKVEFFENASQLQTDAIFEEAFDALKQIDIEISEFDELMTGIAMTISFAIKRLGGKLKVSEMFYSIEFLRMMHLRCIVETTCMMQHLNHFNVTLKKAGIKTSKIPKIIEKAMERAETKVTYDGNNDSYLDDCVNEMARICQVMGKPISKKALMPPIEKGKKK